MSELDRIDVCSAVELGRSLGLRVVAEGVEQPELVDDLLAVGCGLAQGTRSRCLGWPRPLTSMPSLTLCPYSPVRTLDDLEFERHWANRLCWAGTGKSEKVR